MEKEKLNGLGLPEKGWPKLNKCKVCGYLHGCHKVGCPAVSEK